MKAVKYEEVKQRFFLLQQLKPLSTFVSDSAMDLLHSSGVSSTYYLQTHFSHCQDYFLSVSVITDLHNTFFLLFPICFHVRQVEAIKLVWVAVVGDWLNLMLKW